MTSDDKEAILISNNRSLRLIALAAWICAGSIAVVVYGIADCRRELIKLNEAVVDMRKGG